MSHPEAAPWRPTDLWPCRAELKRPGWCDFCWAYYFTTPLSKARQPLENGSRVPFGSINTINRVLVGSWVLFSCPPHLFPARATCHCPLAHAHPSSSTPHSQVCCPGLLCDWPTSDILGIPISASSTWLGDGAQAGVPLLCWGHKNQTWWDPHTR